MSQIAITTSQNVNINFALASIGDRIVAFIIDSLIRIAFISFIYYIVLHLLGIGDFLGSIDTTSAMALFTIITLPAHIYTLVLESLMEGQTFGKKLMKIKVVKIDGYQATFTDFFIRWIFRLIDIYITAGIAGVLSMILSTNNQRLGGLASGTAVISLKNNINISHTILENLKEDYIPTFPQVIALSDNDMRIIKANYQKATLIDDRQVITKLSDKIKEIIKVDFDKTAMTEKQFVGIVIKDYNFYTGKEA